MKMRNFVQSFLLVSFFGGSAIALHPNAGDKPIHCTHMTQEKCERVKKKRSSCFDEESTKFALEKSNGVPLCAGEEFLHLCYCSCFHPDTKILASIDEGASLEWHAISDLALLQKKPYVAVIARDSTIKNLKFELSLVEEWITSDVPHDMIQIQTITGRQVVLTELHALLMPNGALKLAKDLAIGDELVGYNGSIEVIVSLKNVVSERGIINLLTSGEANIQHLVAANEVIAGDLSWENWLLRDVKNIQIAAE